MSEFLMVVPEGWTEVAPEAWAGMSLDDLSRWIAEGSFYDFDALLEASGQLPEGQAVVNARLFRAGAIDRLWVLFGAA